MTAQICAITGATGGIGSALADRAASDGCSLVLHGRSERKLQQLIDRLEHAYPNLRFESVVGDLSTAAGAKKVAAEIADKAPEFDILFNNAGVLIDGIQMSGDGLDMHTQVNLIAPYILMQSLKPNVAKTKGAIVNVSSGAALRVRSLSVETLVEPKSARKIFGAYASSKLALSVVTRALGASYSSEGIALASVNPGPNKTEMTSGGGMPRWLKLIRPFIYSSPEQGAAKVFDVCAIERRHSQQGAFYNGRKLSRLPEFTYSSELEESLLEFCNRIESSPLENGI